MRHVIDSYNALSRNRIFVIIKSIFTSPLFIVIYCILGALLTLFLLYKVGIIWIWINTRLIEKGYLSKIKGHPDMDDLALGWCMIQVVIFLVSILLIIGICVLIFITIDHI